MISKRSDIYRNYLDKKTGRLINPIQHQLWEADLLIFEGFDIQSSFVNYGDYLLPDIPCIVTDFNCHVYYNLHGSAYWYLKDLNRVC
jgi:hypothetical protein